MINFACNIFRALTRPFTGHTSRTKAVVRPPVIDRQDMNHLTEIGSGMVEKHYEAHNEGRTTPKSGRKLFLLKCLDHLPDLLYPRNCSICGTPLFEDESEICQMCLRRLPRTYFEINPRDNVMSSLLWGRCKVHCAFALFYYRKGEQTQQLLHKIKYKGHKKLGLALGRHLGKTIKSTLNEFDYILPVPLHHKKKSIRGFNQSEVIGEGISQIVDSPLLSSVLYRKADTFTQTRKGRFERWKNVENIFGLRDAMVLRHQHILLVDDVITTGSTLEACVNTLNTVEGIRVSIATIACVDL